MFRHSVYGLGVVSADAATAERFSGLSCTFVRYIRGGGRTGTTRAFLFLRSCFYKWLLHCFVGLGQGKE